MLPAYLRTKPLTKRRWKVSDIELFVVMNQDPEVMEFARSELSREESIKLIAQIEARFESRAYKKN